MQLFGKLSRIAFIFVLSVFVWSTVALAQSPIPTSGLRVWLDAGQGVGTDGTGVNSWTDTQSGNSPALSVTAPANSSQEPIPFNDALNGHRVIRFNGSLNFLSNSNFDILNGASDISVFAVVVPGLQNPSATIIDHSYNGSAAGPLAVQPVSVVSRLMHPAAGTFDVNLPLIGTPGIESRLGSPASSYMIVMTFPTTVSFGNASVTAGSGTVTTTTGTGSNMATITVTGVTNTQTITVKLPNVSDGTNSNDVSVQMSVLYADVNANGRVDAADVSFVRSQTLLPLTTSNFRADINVSGRVDAADVSVARQNTLTTVPIGPTHGFALLQSGSANNAYQFRFGGGDGFAQGQDPNATAPLYINRPQIVSVVKNFSTQVLDVNQAQVGSTSVAASIADGSLPFGVGGAVSVNNRNFQGDIAEIIIYNRALTDAEKQQVTDYLDSKYAISPAISIPRNGLRAWFRADTGVTVDQSGNVGSWADLLNGLTANPTSGLPSWSATGANGKPAVHFACTNALKSSATNLLGGANDFSVFVVAKPGSSQVANGCIFDHDVDTQPYDGFAMEGGQSNPNSYHLRWESPTNGFQGTALELPLSSTAPQIASTIKSGGTETMSVVNQSGTNTASLAVDPNIVTGSNAFLIGGSAAFSGHCYQGDISEIIIYNRALSTSEQQQVQSYLSDNYALYGTQFTFTLDGSYKTSAGVYKTDGTLIRTLWRNVTYGPGTITRSWDGKDDSGAQVAGGTSYQIKVLYHNTAYAFDGVIGNTSNPNPPAGSNIHGWGSIHNMAIDGTNAFYATDRNEGHTSQHYFSLANATTKQQQTDMGHIDRFIYFDQVTTDGTWVYYSCLNSGFADGTGPYSTFVTAFNVSDLSQATFTSGQSVTTRGFTWPSCIDVDSQNPSPPSTPPSNQNGATGLAVQKSGSILAVAHGPLNVVRLFNKTSGAPLNTINVTNPQGMAMDPNGDLWVISGTSVLRYTGLSGTPSLAATISGLMGPVAVAVHPSDANTVLVADGGTSQTVKAFTAAGGTTPSWTYGQAGGYATRGPDVTNDKFGFALGSRFFPVYHTPLSVQSDGSFWVGDGATSRLLHFSSARAYIEQIAYTVHNVTCAADFNTPTRVIADDFLEYFVDYRNPIEQSWTLTKNWAAGLGSQYIGNSAGAFGALRSVVTLSNGRTYGLLEDFSTSDPQDPGQPRQAVVELPEPLNSGGLRVTGEFVDRVYTAPSYFGGTGPSQRPSLEPDGSLRYPIVSGGKMTFYQRSLAQPPFDAAGNPQWVPTGQATILGSAPYTDSDPASLDDAAPVETRHPITSSNILVSFDGSLQKTSLSGGRITNTGFRLGGVPTGGDFNRWSSKSSPTVSTDVPFDGLGSFDIGDGVQYGGSIAMAIGQNVVYDYFGEFWNQTQASQWMHFYDDGLFVGQFGTSGDVQNPSGRPVPGFAGFDAWPSMIAVNTSNNNQAPNGANGETYIWANDEDSHFGLIRWHILGANTIRELSGTGALGTQITLSTGGTASYPTGLKGVPGNTQVALTWNAATGASGYNVKYSTRTGGPYTTLATNVSGTSYTVTSAPNNTVRYYVVSAANNDATNSNEAPAAAFNTIAAVGSMAGGQKTPWQVTSSGVDLAQPVLQGINPFIGNLVRTSVGSTGYAIYDWGGFGPTNTGVDALNVRTGFGIAKSPSNWKDYGDFILNRFTLDGKLGQDACLYVDLNVTGTVNVTVNDSNVHYLTVFCPALSDSNRHAFTVTLTPAGLSSPAATYTVDDPGSAAQNHIFQFEFTGNVTLSVKSTGTIPFTVNGSLQAVFLD